MKAKDVPLASNARPADGQRSDAAIALLRTWMAEDSGYDEQTWPRVKKAIEANRLSARKRFND